MGWNQKTEVLQSGNCLCVCGGGGVSPSIAYMYKSELYFIYFEMKQFSSVLPFELSICQSVEFDVCIWPQISCFNIWNIKEIEVIFATHDCMLWIWISLKACTTLMTLSKLSISSEKSTQLRSFTSIPLLSLTWKPETLRDPLDLLICRVFFVFLFLFIPCRHVDSLTPVINISVYSYM